MILNDQNEVNQMHHMTQTTQTDQTINIKHALNVRSDFSIGQSLLRVDHIIDEARHHGYESVALVDDMSVSAMVDFTRRARQAGLKPIIGCRLRVVDDPTYRKPPAKSGAMEQPNPLAMIKVFPTSETGMMALLKLLSKANSKAYFVESARVGWDDVMALEEVVLSTGDFFNLFQHERHDAILDALRTRFGQDRLFVELVPIDTPLYDALNVKALQGARRLRLPTLATYPFLYRQDEEAPSLAVMRAIATQSTMNDARQPRPLTTRFGFRPPMALAQQVAAAASRVLQSHGVAAPQQWADALRHIDVFAARCQYEFKKQPLSLPRMADNEFEVLGQKCVAGWKARLARPVLGYQPTMADLPAYKERLRYELSVLQRMNFSGYFLLVEDLVAWARNHDILVGPGRGSVGGSLIAFLIGITDVDPIRFNLLFERFINPERLDLPDADLDFMSTRRHDVVDYLANRYGTDRVAGISNFTTLGAASALRDTGRVHELDSFTLAVSKRVPKDHGQPMALSQAADTVPELARFREAYPDVWRHALKLEGTLRSLGTHAAGVVVAGEPLTQRAVIENRTGEEGIGVVNWDKRVVEDWGLVKMDILGLSTLDVLAVARHYIQERHGKTIDYLSLPLDEPDIMDHFARGDTTGVFQFESSGMKQLLRDLAQGGPLTFEDIAAATALYRPGPIDSGLMHDFVQIRQGHRAPSYDHPHMEAALKATGSVIVYQEQVMQLAVDVAGFSRADADRLRSAMGKKAKEKMAAMRQQWLTGCQRTSGMDSGMAGELFDKIAAFAGYGFNRSHAIEYSVMSVWTMWLRVRYRAEYFAACLSVVDDDDKLTGLVLHAQACGITVLPPDINLSSNRFVILDDHHLLAPFNKVMGISDTTANHIVALREKYGTRVRQGDELTGAYHRRFLSVAQFKAAAATKGAKVNVKAVAHLEQVGALASIDPASPSAQAYSRRKDQMRLMPGLMVDVIKADRMTHVDRQGLRGTLNQIGVDYRRCQGCDLASQPHPVMHNPTKVKFVVVSDCPSWEEQRGGKLLHGEVGELVKTAMRSSGLLPIHGYFTNLVKARKTEKYLSPAQVSACAPFLERELDLIRPPVIVALGWATIRHFLPGIKGTVAELAGHSVYDPKRDATIVCGINPQQLVYDATNAGLLTTTFDKVAALLD